MVVALRMVDFLPVVFSRTAFEKVDSLCLVRQSQYTSRPRTWKSSTAVFSAMTLFFDASSRGDARKAIV